MTTTYTLEEIEALHRKYAPSNEVFDLVFTHCQIVRDIALQLIENGTFKVDSSLVEAGAMLHDIGVHSLFDAYGELREGVDYITHGTEGEIILKKEDLPESICRFAAHHTGVGISKQDVVNQNLPLPVADYLAETDEELLVMYADKFHSKTNPLYFNSFEWYSQYVTQFGANKAVTFEQMAQKFGIPNLEGLSRKYGFEIR